MLNSAGMITGNMSPRMVFSDFSGPVFNLAQRACDQSITSADHACSLGQKNGALQITLMNNHSQSRCYTGKFGHQQGVWRSWKAGMGGDGWPLPYCPSSVGPVSTRTHGHISSAFTHVHTLSHLSSIPVSCPKAPN